MDNDDDVMYRLMIPAGLLGLEDEETAAWEDMRADNMFDYLAAWSDGEDSTFSY